MNLKHLLIYLFVLILLFFYFTTSSTNYYPLSVGNYWDYTAELIFEEKSFTGPYKMSVTGVNSIDGRNNFVLKDSSGNIFYLYPTGNRIYLLKEELNGVIFLYDPPLLLYDFGSSKWDWKGKYNSRYCVNNGRFEEFTSYTTVQEDIYFSLVVASNFSCSDNYTKTTRTLFSEGVGIIKQEVVFTFGNTSTAFIIDILNHSKS